VLAQLIKGHSNGQRQIEPLRHQAVVISHFHLRVIAHMNGLQGLAFEQSEYTSTGQIIRMDVVGVDVIFCT
jgi:hypothetical protein